jgi:hypothetical protein
VLGFFIDSTSFLNSLTSSIISIFPKYESYSDLSNRLRDFGNFGFGAILIFILNIIPLIFYNKIKNEYPESKKYFILFAIGTSLMYAFSRYMMLERSILYLSFCSIYVLAYTYRYLKLKRKPLYYILNTLIFTFLIVKFIYVLPIFVETQITNDKFSLWFISMVKTLDWI